MKIPLGLRMRTGFDPFSFLVLSVAGWLNQRQQHVIEYLVEENRLEHFWTEVEPILTSTLDYEATLKNIAELAVRDLADFCLVDVVENHLVRRIKALSQDPSKAWACELFMQVPLAPGRRPLAGRVYETRQTMFIPFLSPELLLYLVRKHL